MKSVLINQKHIYLIQFFFWSLYIDVEKKGFLLLVVFEVILTISIFSLLTVTFDFMIQCT